MPGITRRIPPRTVKIPPSRLTQTSEWILRAAKPSELFHSGCSPRNDPARALNVAPVATSEPIQVRTAAANTPTARVTASCAVMVEFDVDVKLENPNLGERSLGVA